MHQGREWAGMVKTASEVGGKGLGRVGPSDAIIQLFRGGGYRGEQSEEVRTERYQPVTQKKGGHWRSVSPEYARKYLN